MRRGVIITCSVLCPVLFTVFPMLSLFADNQSEVELSLLSRPLLVGIVAALALFGVFFLITKRFANAGVLASVVVVGFLFEGVFFGQTVFWFLLLWLATIVAAVVAVLRSRRDLVNVVAILTVAAAAMVVPQVVNVVTWQASHSLPSATDPRLWPTSLEVPNVPSGVRPPDIYVIIPDDYARADVLQEYFHYDNSEFLTQLEQRGFIVSVDNRSPYSDSESNVASLLNMDYLTNFGNVLGDESQDVRLVKRVSEDNRAARLLSSIGYDYIQLDTDEVSFAGGNPGISSFAAPDSFANLLMRKTILREIGGPIGFDQSATEARYRDAIRSEFAKLGAIPDGPRPKFVVFHTLIPHDPYVYDERGRSVTYRADADIDLSSDAGRAAYIRQLRYTSQLLLDAVDQILANATTPPVIVIAADEGFQAEPEVFGEAAGREIRVKGLSAFYLPGLDHPSLPDPPNSVNDLRIVFNDYLGTHYAMLDSVSYAEGDFPYQGEEIDVT